MIGTPSLHFAPATMWYVSVNGLVSTLTRSTSTGSYERFGRTRNAPTRMGDMMVRVTSDAHCARYGFRHDGSLLSPMTATLEGGGTGGLTGGQADEVG